LFPFFDVDGNGEVSVREFVDALRSYGFDTKNPEIYQMIADMDEDGNN
jgi:Ca2+-binding EF-hand superfamily protein